MLMIGVVIIIPGTALRLGVRSLIEQESDLRILAEHPGLIPLPEIHPGADVIVLLNRPGAIADLAETLAGRNPLPGVLFLGEGRASADDVGELPVAGWGWLSADATGLELAAAIRAVAAGLVAGSPDLLALAFRERRNPDYLPDEFAPPLTGRELEVLGRLAAGLSNRQIAAILHISEHTVKFHISSLFAKLGAASRTEAVKLAVQRGLIAL